MDTKNTPTIAVKDFLDHTRILRLTQLKHSGEEIVNRESDLEQRNQSCKQAQEHKKCFCSGAQKYLELTCYDKKGLIRLGAHRFLLPDRKKIVTR